MNRSCDLINITIVINNTRDNNIQKELRNYKLYSKTKIKLNDNKTIEDYFTDKDDSDLDIYDKDETIMYAILIKS